MWCRKRIDIAFSDLLAGVFASLFRRDPVPFHKALENVWPASDRAVLACLSVRSGWDLLLSELKLPKGSEVLMSAMTIPDMALIVKAHGLVPVPLELDPKLAAPTLETLRQAITSKSKLVLIAHLFGNRVDLNPHIAIAREHGLLFLEDCAQAYTGPEFAGHEKADVSMFSFGNIKTSTALGGGVFHLNDANLRNRLQDRQAGYPLQSRWFYFKRLWKYAGLKLLSTYLVFGLFVGICRVLGINRNEMLNRSVRGFAGTEGVERFRMQPCAPLLSVLLRRLAHPRPWRIQWQKQLGLRLSEKIQPAVVCPGTRAGYHHYWVFPVLTDYPRELMAVLSKAGFDSTQGDSLCIIEKPQGSPAMEPDISRDLLKRMVYVPMYPELTMNAVEKMGEVLLQFFKDHPNQEPIPPTKMEQAARTLTGVTRDV